MTNEISDEEENEAIINRNIGWKSVYDELKKKYDSGYDKEEIAKQLETRIDELDNYLGSSLGSSHFAYDEIPIEARKEYEKEISQDIPLWKKEKIDEEFRHKWTIYHDDWYANEERRNCECLLADIKFGTEKDSISDLIKKVKQAIKANDKDAGNLLFEKLTNLIYNQMEELEDLSEKIGEMWNDFNGD